MYFITIGFSLSTAVGAFTRKTWSGAPLREDRAPSGFLPPPPIPKTFPVFSLPLCYNPTMNRREREITCCFTGHRPEKLPWGRDETDPRCRALKAALAEVLEAVYLDGWRHFIGGMADGADLYFAEAAAALRRQHPDLTLEGAIPCQGQERRWSAASRARYARAAESCDLLTVLRPEYVPGCMMERNRYMVDRSSLLIAVGGDAPGGTRRTLEYAADRGLKIIQLPLLGLPEPRETSEASP